MLVANRESKQYDEYAMPKKETFGYFNRSYDDYDEGYEAQKRDTSNCYRDELMNSLQFHQAHSESNKQYVVRDAADNNFDRMLDRKYGYASKAENQEKRPRKVRKQFLITYCVFAFATIIAVVLSLVNFSTSSTASAIGSVALANPSVETANAEDNFGAAAAVPETESKVAVASGEDYIRLADGTLMQISVPAAQVATSEKESGFDKFCNWLNDAFGG